MSEVAFRETKATADHVGTVCGHCQKPFVPGMPLFYFHSEEMHDFCSNACLQAYYADDSEAHEMTAGGYQP